MVWFIQERQNKHLILSFYLLACKPWHPKWFPNCQGVFTPPGPINSRRTHKGDDESTTHDPEALLKMETAIPPGPPECEAPAYPLLIHPQEPQEVVARLMLQVRKCGLGSACPCSLCCVCLALFAMPAAGDEKYTNVILIFKHGRKILPSTRVTLKWIPGLSRLWASPKRMCVFQGLTGN